MNSTPIGSAVKVEQGIGDVKIRLAGYRRLVAPFAISISRPEPAQPREVMLQRAAAAKMECPASGFRVQLHECGTLLPDVRPDSVNLAALAAQQPVHEERRAGVQSPAELR